MLYFQISLLLGRGPRESTSENRACYSKTDHYWKFEYFFLSNSKSMNVCKKQCLPVAQIPKNQFETPLLVAKKQTRQAKAHKYDQISTLYIPIICPITKENNFVIHKSIFFERGTFRSTNC